MLATISKPLQCVRYDVDKICLSVINNILSTIFLFVFRFASRANLDLNQQNGLLVNKGFFHCEKRKQLYVGTS